MEKRSLLTRMTTVACLLSWLVIGCKKESSNTLSTQEEEQTAVYTTESETEAQFVFDDIFNNVIGVNSELGIAGVGIFGRTLNASRADRTDTIPGCVTVSITPLQPNSFPKTVALDFGSGCASHGHLRSGKITTVYTGRLLEAGKSATTTLENFRIDSISVSGTLKITNTTTLGGNQRQFRLEITGAKLSKPSGDYEEWNAGYVHTQTEGNITPLPGDDNFRITGNSDGKTKRGSLLVAWTSVIQEPLIKRFTCRWFSDGTIKTVRNGLPANTQWVGILDYGDGTCDNKATVTVNGNPHQITLH